MEERMFFCLESPCRENDLTPRLARAVFPWPSGCVQVYHELKSVIKEKYGQDACNVGDEGGFAPNIQSNLEGIELLMAAIKKAGYEDKVSLPHPPIFPPSHPTIAQDRKDPRREGMEQWSGREVEKQASHLPSPGC